MPDEQNKSSETQSPSAAHAPTRNVPQGQPSWYERVPIATWRAWICRGGAWDVSRSAETGRLRWAPVRGGAYVESALDVGTGLPVDAARVGPSVEIENVQEQRAGDSDPAFSQSDVEGEQRLTAFLISTAIPGAPDLQGEIMNAPFADVVGIVQREINAYAQRDVVKHAESVFGRGTGYLVDDTNRNTARLIAAAIPGALDVSQEIMAAPFADVVPIVIREINAYAQREAAVRRDMLRALLDRCEVPCTDVDLAVDDADLVEAAAARVVEARETCRTETGEYKRFEVLHSVRDALGLPFVEGQGGQESLDQVLDAIRALRGQAARMDLRDRYVTDVQAERRAADLPPDETAEGILRAEQHERGRADGLAEACRILGILALRRDGADLNAGYVIGGARTKLAQLAKQVADGHAAAQLQGMRQACRKLGVEECGSGVFECMAALEHYAEKQRAKLLREARTTAASILASAGIEYDEGHLASLSPMQAIDYAVERVEAHIAAPSTAEADIIDNINAAVASARRNALADACEALDVAPEQIPEDDGGCLALIRDFAANVAKHVPDGHVAARNINAAAAAARRRALADACRGLGIRTAPATADECMRLILEFAAPVKWAARERATARFWGLREACRKLGFDKMPATADEATAALEHYAEEQRTRPSGEHAAWREVCDKLGVKVSAEPSGWFVDRCRLALGGLYLEIQELRAARDSTAKTETQSVLAAVMAARHNVLIDVCEALGIREVPESADECMSLIRARGTRGPDQRFADQNYLAGLRAAIGVFWEAGDPAMWKGIPACPASIDDAHAALVRTREAMEKSTREALDSMEANITDRINAAARRITLAHVCKALGIREMPDDADERMALIHKFGRNTAPEQVREQHYLHGLRVALGLFWPFNDAALRAGLDPSPASSSAAFTALVTLRDRVNDKMAQAKMQGPDRTATARDVVNDLLYDLGLNRAREVLDAGTAGAVVACGARAVREWTKERMEHARGSGLLDGSYTTALRILNGLGIKRIEPAPTAADIEDPEARAKEEARRAVEAIADRIEDRIQHTKKEADSWWSEQMQARKMVGTDGARRVLADLLRELGLDNVRDETLNAETVAGAIGCVARAVLNARSDARVSASAGGAREVAVSALSSLCAYDEETGEALRKAEALGFPHVAAVFAGRVRDLIDELRASYEQSDPSAPPAPEARETPAPLAPDVQTFDPVERPSHYASGGIECIDAIEAALQGDADGVSAFLRGQVIKYIWRMHGKGAPLQDAGKAAWYLRRLIARLSGPGEPPTRHDELLQSVAEQERRMQDGFRRDVRAAMSKGPVEILTYTPEHEKDLCTWMAQQPCREAHMPAWWRGYAIEERGGKWVYSDTGKAVADEPARSCGSCGLPNRPDGHDACLGELPGVMNACCGHGQVSDAYVQLADGRSRGGIEALQFAFAAQERNDREKEVQDLRCQLDDAHRVADNLYDECTGYRRTDAEREADRKVHARRITAPEAETIRGWMARRAGKAPCLDQRVIDDMHDERIGYQRTDAEREADRRGRGRIFTRAEFDARMTRQAGRAEQPTPPRDARQADVHVWCARAFGVEHATNLEQRAVRFLEEALELFQAAGGGEEMAGRLITRVFGNPSGEIAQELGGAGVTLLALASAAGLSADAEERRETERVLAISDEVWAQRHAAKRAEGLDVVESAAHPEHDRATVYEAAMRCAAEIKEMKKAQGLDVSADDECLGRDRAAIYEAAMRRSAEIKAGIERGVLQSFDVWRDRDEALTAISARTPEQAAQQYCAEQAPTTIDVCDVINVDSKTASHRFTVTDISDDFRVFTFEEASK